jgi:hypothetical protein
LVTFDTRVSVVPLSVVVILLVAACRGGGAHVTTGGGSETRVTTGGGGGNTETSTPIFGPLAMMTNDDCTYQGDTTLATGRFTVHVENHSRYDGAFALARIAAGATRADVEAFPKKVRQRLKRGNLAPVGPPPYTNVVTTTVGYGLVSELPVDVPAGKYALVCFQETSPNALRALYLATLLEVSE